MADQYTFIRIPTTLLHRAEAQWDRLMAHPAFGAAAPRRSGAAAIRMIVQWKLQEMEDAGTETTEDA